MNFPSLFEKGSNVLHDYWSDAVVYDVSEVFELVVSVLDYGQFLTELEVSVYCV